MPEGQSLDQTDMEPPWFQEHQTISNFLFQEDVISWIWPWRPPYFQYYIFFWKINLHHSTRRSSCKEEFPNLQPQSQGTRRYIYAASNIILLPYGTLDIQPHIRNAGRQLHHIRTLRIPVLLLLVTRQFP